MAAINVIIILTLSMVAMDCCGMEISVYYESYCPASREFLFNQLGPTYNMIPQLSIKLVPYGDAIERVNNNGHVTFKCRHGEDECLANLIQGCAIENYPNLKSVPFVACCSDVLEDPVEESSTCAALSGIEWETLYNCSQSAAGIKIAHKMRNATEDTYRTYYPWIMIDNNHNQLDDIWVRSDLLSYICSIWPKETLLPKACKDNQ